MIGGAPGTDHGMEYGTFDSDAFSADLQSDEGADPVMFLSPMAPWWIALCADLFARPN